MVFAPFLVCLFLGTIGASVRYDGFKVLEFHPRTRNDMEMVRALEHDHQLEMIREPSADRPGLLLASPSMFASLSTQFSSRGVPFTVYKHDVQQEIDKEFERLSKRDTSDYDPDDFNDFETIMGQLKTWREKCPAGVTCETMDIGMSHEKRPLSVIKIGKAGPNKKAIWLDSAIHPREWISIGTMQKIIDHLINDYETDSTVKRMVDTYDWYLMPIANPDGYVYTWTKDRLWRKNRKPHGVCVGADLNRNFNVEYWGEEGVSAWPCDSIYCGPSAGSEPETQVIQREMDRLFTEEDVVAWLVLHGFGNMWMYAPAHTENNAGSTCATSKNEPYMRNVTDVAVNALEATNNRQGTWKRGSICKTIYPVTGSVTEYALEKGLVNSYALELRGTWFVIDKKELEPSYKEVWNGVVAMLDQIKRLG